MPTPSLFPYFLKAAAGGGVSGTEFIETFGLEMIELLEIALVQIDVDIEVVEDIVDIEVIEIIDVEITC